MKTSISFFTLCVLCSLQTLNAQKTQQELQAETTAMTELTGYILQPSFENSVSHGAVSPEWTNSGFQGQSNTAFAEKTGTFYCEKWAAASGTPESHGGVADAHVYQTITIPNGSYILTVDAIATWQTDETLPVTGVFLVAQDGAWNTDTQQRTPVLGRQNFTNANSTACITYYLPVTVTSGTATIGVLTEGATANYVRFDNVRLYTDNPVPVLANDIMKRLNTLDSWLGELPKGYEYMLYDSPQPLYYEASDLASNSNDVVELKSMVDLLDNIVLMAEEGKKIHSRLVSGVIAASDLTVLAYPGLSTFSEAIAQANAILYSNEAMNEEFQAGLDALTAATIAYKFSNAINVTAAEPADYTFALINPRFDDRLTGWSATNWSTFDGTNTKWTGWDAEYDAVPAMNIVLDAGANNSRAYQVLTGMPTGFYELSAVGRGQAGTPDLTLFINNGTDADNTGGTMELTNIFNRVGDGATSTILGYGWERISTGKIAINGGTITVGVRLGATGGWESADDFKLTYYGANNWNAQVLDIKISQLAELNIEGTMTARALAAVQEILASAEQLVLTETYSGAEYERVLAAIDSIIPLTKSRIAAYAKYADIDMQLTDFVNRGESEACDLIALVQEQYSEALQGLEDADAALPVYVAELNKYYAFATTYMTYEAYYSKDEFTIASVQDYYAQVSATLASVAEQGLSGIEPAKVALSTALQVLFNTNVTEGDVTSLLANPGFEEATGTNIPGWTNGGMNVANNGNFWIFEESASSSTDVKIKQIYTGANFVEQWVASANRLPNRHLYQTVALPNGNYTISGDANGFRQNKAETVTGYYFIAKNGQWTGYEDPIMQREEVLPPYNTNAEEDLTCTYSITLDITTGYLTFGVMTYNTTANWTMADNFTLTLNKKFGVGIEEISDEPNLSSAIRVEGRRLIAPNGASVYNVQGIPMSTDRDLPAGLYLVRLAGRTYKVLIP